MQAMIYFLILYVITLLSDVQAAHYKGGTITWKPTNPNATGSRIEILISEKHSFTLTGRYFCNQNTINNQLSYVDAVGPSHPDLICQSSSATTCSSSYFLRIYRAHLCTDYSTQLDSSTGAYYEKQNLSNTADINIAFTDVAWASEILRTGYNTSASWWYVGTQIKLGTTYPINSSPVTGSLPIIRVIENRTATIQIPAADWDIGQDIRCRWASDSAGYGSECRDICGNLGSATISASDCTITWYAVRRPKDIATNRATSTYVAAIMVEDFLVSQSNTTRLSGVPLQMLIFVYRLPSGACANTPEITGDRPNRACIGVDIGALVTERIVATVYCSGDSIVEFLTTSPLYMNKTSIALVSGTTNQYYITLKWVPVADQYGPQVFCAAPIDQRGLTGSQYCITFVVGYRSPELNTPISIQGSASPLGTVFSNHTLFSITASTGVNRPTRNGTYIKIYLLSNNTMVWSVDCGWSPLVTYTGTTVIFTVSNPPWVEGETYYILFDSGAVSGNVFCGPESAPITSNAYWRFDIWKSSRSSTTTTTTTPPTTHTVTTLGMATTTPIANLTTTGIVITTTNASITTTTTTTVSTSTTSTASTTTTTTSLLVYNVSIMTPKDFEDACRSPVAVMTGGMSTVMIVVQAVSMFAFFSQIGSSFNPNQLSATARHATRVRRMWH